MFIRILKEFKIVMQRNVVEKKQRAKELQRRHLLSKVKLRFVKLQVLELVINQSLPPMEPEIMMLKS
jgi:hypothetical protein